MPRGSTSASGEKLWREKSSPELSRVLPLYVEEERVRSVPSGANSSGVGSPEVMSSICRQYSSVCGDETSNFLEHGHFWNRSETLDPSSSPATNPSCVYRESVSRKRYLGPRRRGRLKTISSLRHMQWPRGRPCPPFAVVGRASAPLERCALPCAQQH